MLAFLQTTVGFGAILAVLYGLACLIKPFWLIRKRRYGALTCLGGVMVLVGLGSIPPKKPADLSQAEWNRRLAICREADATKNCPLTEASVEQAQARIPELRRIRERNEKEVRDHVAKASEPRAPKPRAAEEPRRRDKDDELDWINVTQDHVRQSTRDPSSAQFRGSKVYYFKNKTPVVCGEINSKNGFGGYTGYQRFIASGEKFGPFLEEMMEPREFYNSWREFCS